MSTTPTMINPRGWTLRPELSMCYGAPVWSRIKDARTDYITLNGVTLAPINWHMCPPSDEEELEAEIGHIKAQAPKDWPTHTLPLTSQAERALSFVAPEERRQRVLLCANLIAIAGDHGLILKSHVLQACGEQA